MNVYYEINITDIRKILDEVRRVICRLTGKTLNLYSPTIRSILKYHLYVTKVCGVWIPYRLTEDQKTNMWNGVRKYITFLIRNNNNFLRSNSFNTMIYRLKLKTKFEYFKISIAVIKSWSVKKIMTAVFIKLSEIVQRCASDIQITAKKYSK